MKTTNSKTYEELVLSFAPGNSDAHTHTCAHTHTHTNKHTYHNFYSHNKDRSVQSFLTRKYKTVLKNTVLSKYIPVQTQKPIHKHTHNT